MRTMQRRLQKLERRLPDQEDPSSRTSDELSVRVLDLLFSVFSTLPEGMKQGESTDNVDDHTQTDQIVDGIGGIFSEIVEAYAKRSNPGYSDYLDRVAAEWKAHHNRNDDYVPALLGDEYDGFKYPDLMVRRQAVLSNPVVRCILEKCETETVPKWWSRPATM